MKFKGENERVIELGGLQFWVGYRSEHEGTTTRVLGPIDGEWIELLRFDDFLDKAHYHIPASARDEHGQAIEIPFDRPTMGEARVFYLDQIAHHLGAMLTQGGYGALVPEVDFDAVERGVDQIASAMDECLPAEMTYVSGHGLARLPEAAAGVPQPS